MKTVLDRLYPELMGLLAAAGAERSGTPATAITDRVAPMLPPAAPCQLTDFNTTGYHLNAKVAPAQLIAAVEILDRHGFAIDAITGVDWIAADEMELIYD